MHELKNKWFLYEHQNTNQNYEQNTKKLGEFQSIEEFWKYFNNYPSPSKLFYHNNIKPKLSNPPREISSISLFKKNIFPKWEDEKNKNGGDLAIRSFESMEQIDQIWETTAIMCIGEIFTNSNYINGIRVVDSSIPNKKKLYRIEIWFSDKNQKEEIEKDLKTKIGIDNIELFYKEHSTAVESTPHRYKKYNNHNKSRRNYGFR